MNERFGSSCRLDDQPSPSTSWTATPCCTLWMANSSLPRCGRLLRVFSATGDGRPDPTGSGVLLAVAGRYFFLTAAHLLDHSEVSTLYVAVDGSKAVELLGTSYTSGLPASGRRDDDETDVGFVELAEETAGRLPPEAFVSATDLDVADTATSRRVIRSARAKGNRGTRQREGPGRGRGSPGPPAERSQPSSDCHRTWTIIQRPSIRARCM